MRKKRWKCTTAGLMCTVLMLSAPAVYAADEQPGVQTEAGADVQGTGEVKKGDKVPSEDVTTETVTTNDADVTQENANPEISNVGDSVKVSTENNEELQVTGAAGDFVIEKGVLIKYNGTASDVTIPDIVTSIDENAFSGCTTIEKLTIPGSITYIGGDNSWFSDQLVSLTVYGNNTTIEGYPFVAAMAYNKPTEITLKGTFAEIGGGAFAHNQGLEKVTIDGYVKNMWMSTFFDCDNLQKIIVTGDIAYILHGEYGLEVNEDTIIHCKNDTNILQFAKDKGMKYEIIEGKPDIPPNLPEHTIDITTGDTGVKKSDMQNLVSINKIQKVVIKSINGVTFTFPKGSMKMINGKDAYDFGTELISDFSKLTNTPFSKETFAFRINFDYEGELPGTASISIPVDSKWIGKTLYYYQIVGDEEFKYLTSGVVDANGIYTISQNHCSDYVATTQAPDTDGKPTPTRSSNPPPGKGKNLVSVDTIKTCPKTGDNNSFVFYIIAVLSALSIGAVCIRRRTRIK